MGAYLSEPITKKEITEEEDDNFWVSSASMQGWRTNQEVRILKMSKMSYILLKSQESESRICIILHICLLKLINKEKK